MSHVGENQKCRVGQLWQVPLFLLGAAAFCAALHARGLWPTPESRRLHQYADSARQALAKNPPETQSILRNAEEFLQLAQQSSEHHGEACFLVGSAHYFLAQASNGSFAQEQWLRACDLLERAEKIGVDERDRPRLRVRLGAMHFRAGDDSQCVVDYLKDATPDICDDPAKTFSMLAQSYLRLPIPDYAAAYDATQKLLGLPIDEEEILGPARLMAGETLLELKRPVEARAMLSRISPDSPAEVYMKARLLQARSCQDVQLWHDAAQLWQEVLSDRRMSPPNQGRVLVDLGLCQKELGNSAHAVRAWELSLKHEGDHLVAAEIALAEHHLSGNRPDKAMPYLESLARVESDMLKGSERDARRRLFDRAAQLYVDNGDADRCAALYRMMDATTAPSKVLEKTAQALEIRAAKMPDQARDSYAQAAAAYAQLSEQESPQQTAWLWKSADRFAQAEQPEKAVAQLERYIARETMPERLGQAWLLMAQCYQALGQQPASHSAYQKCIEYPGAAAFGARLELARIDIGENRLDEAEEILKQNLELMRVAAAADSVVHEQSLYTYADLLYRRNNFRLAALRLQEALDRYPKNTLARQTRQQLADSYRRLASQEHQNLRFGEGHTGDAQAHYRDQYQLWLKLAAASYQKLADDLRRQQSVGLLTAEEDDLLRRSEFAVAECRFDLGQYDEARQLYDQLAQNYRDRLESLSALRQLWRCCWVLRDGDAARATVQRAEGHLKSLEPGLFADQPEKYQEWQRWIEWAVKQ